MRFVTSALAFVFVAVTLQAQQLPAVVTAQQMHFLTPPAGAISSANIIDGIANEESHLLFHFDITLPMRVQQIGGGLQVIMMGQRFTLPAPKAKLDSIHILMPTISVGDIRGLITRDTLALQVGAELFHLPNVYQSAQPIDTFRIMREEVVAMTNAKVDMKGVEVPEEFHIVMFGAARDNIDGFTLAMSMDSIPDNAFTVANTRVSFITGGSLGLLLFDSKNPNYVFLPQLVITANVRYEATGIENPELAGGLCITKLYPQPVSQAKDGSVMLECTFDARQVVSITVSDVMGRKVRDVIQTEMPQGTNLMSVSTAGLAPGTYQVRMSGDRGVSTRMLVITK